MNKYGQVMSANCQQIPFSRWSTLAEIQVPGSSQ